MLSKLIFDHVPKTGGSSVTDVFIKMFNGYVESDSISNFHADLINNYEIFNFGGHLEFYAQEQLSSDWYYCTVLRDPVQRFLSQYFFNRITCASLLANCEIRARELKDPQVIASAALSIDDLSRREDLDRFSSNVQAKHFASRIQGDVNDLSDSDLLDAAIASLEGYNMIGSFAYLQCFVDAVAADFNISPIRLERLNVTPKISARDNVSNETLNILSKKNQVDFKLLEWAGQRFSWGADNDAIMCKPQRIERAGNLTKTNEEPILAKGEVVHCHGIKIVGVQCYGANSAEMIVGVDENILINIRFIATVLEPNLTVGMAVRDRGGELVYGINSAMQKKPICIDQPGYHQVCINLKNKFLTGFYSVTIALHKGMAHHEGCYQWAEDVAAFGVFSVEKWNFEGAVDCEAQISKVESTL